MGCGSGGRIGEGCRRGARRCPREDVARLFRVDTAERDGVCSHANDRRPSPLPTRRCHSPARARRLGQDGMKATGGRWTPGRDRPGLESVLGWEHSKVLNGGVLMDRAGLGGSSSASTKGHSKGDAPNTEGNALRPPGRVRLVGVVLGHLQRAHTVQRPVYVSLLCSCPCEMGLPGLEVTIVRGGKRWGHLGPQGTPLPLAAPRAHESRELWGWGGSGAHQHPGRPAVASGAHLTPPQAALVHPHLVLPGSVESTLL